MEDFEVDLKRSRRQGLVVVVYLIPEYLIRSVEVVTIKNVSLKTSCESKEIFFRDKGRERNLVLIEDRFCPRGFNVKDSGVIYGREWFNVRPKSEEEPTVRLKSAVVNDYHTH